MEADWRDAMRQLEWDHGALLEDQLPATPLQWEDGFDAWMKSKSKDGTTRASATTRTRSTSSKGKAETSQSQYPQRTKRPAYKKMNYAILGGEPSIKKTAGSRLASDSNLRLDDDKDSLASRRDADEDEEAATKSAKKKVKGHQQSNYRLIEDTCSGCGTYAGHDHRYKHCCPYASLLEWFNPNKNIKWIRSAGCAAYRKIHGPTTTCIGTVKERRTQITKFRKLCGETAKRGDSEKSSSQSEYDEEDEDEDEIEE
jgi:hypothetical protein